MATSAQYTMRPVIPSKRDETGSRVTIRNIPAGVTEAQLKANLSRYGDARVHMFVPGCEYTAGWAWVSYEKEEDVKKILETAEQRRGQEDAALRENLKSEAEKKASTEDEAEHPTSADEGQGAAPVHSEDASDA